MIQKFKLTLVSLLAIALPLGIVASVSVATGPVSTVSAQDAIRDGLCNGVELGAVGAAGTCADASEGNTGLSNAVTIIINTFTWIVGVVSVLMIIYGGFKYITSGGDAAGVGAAKNTILYALLGLVIVILAQVIVRFVIGNATQIA